MLGPASRRCASSALHSSYTGSITLPSFLLPAFNPVYSRPFSSSRTCNSKIGQEPLAIPEGVTFDILPPPPPKDDRVLREQPWPTASVKGPLGEILMPVPTYIQIKADKRTGAPRLAIEDFQDRKQRAMWGTTRAYLQNHIIGVSEGHTAILRLVGVGYRTTIEPNATTVKPEYDGQQYVNLKVGFSHPVELGIPFGVKASTPQPTRLLLEGPDKEVVMQFAAKIRKWRVPEPYKGKGIFVNGETIKLKNKKIK